MITILLLNILVLALGVFFSWLPNVETLPTVIGVDVDTALVQLSSYMRRIFDSWWVLGDVFLGLLFLLGYFSIKMVIKFFVGSRAH